MSDQIPKHMPLGAMPEDMANQVREMHARMMEWRKANATKEALVFFKDHPNVIVIGTILQGIQFGLVHTNDHGFDMLRHMCEPYQREKEPTINMVRMAIELEVSDAK